jgi:excinuclease ABC subunit A
LKNSEIVLKGVWENNLKGFDLKIPKNKLIAITGISGSGKSSLVHDVIYKEAQRLFMEALSTDSRRLLKSYSQPKVESISGLSPVVAVSQKTISHHSGSTVGTLSGIYDLLRLLMARFGESKIDISPLKQSRRLFSFNTPYGSCPHCNGVGLEEYINPELIIKDPNLSLREGALKITTPSGYTVYSQVTIDVLNQVCNIEGFDVDTPWNKLSEENKNIIFYGSDKIKIPFGKHSLESRMKWSGIKAKPREEGYYRGIIPIMSEILKRDRNNNILRFVSSAVCSHCNGSRLNKQALSFYFQGKNMADFSNMDIAELDKFFRQDFKNIPNEASYLKLKSEILKYINTLINMGLSYLSLNRKASTLSAGESQRIRLANMTQSSLTGLLYIFDEPSVGLHPSDQEAIKNILKSLVNKGNTVLLIEHEHEMISTADWIIDIGPKAGTNGGELIFSGPYQKFIQEIMKNSITQEYLLRKKPEINIDSKKEKSFFEIKNTNIHNLKSISVKFKRNAINVVCGVSGSGKSSLVIDCLAEDFKRDKRQYLVDDENLPKNIISISQSPIGRTPRSNPATYTKIFDKIRALFAKAEKAKEQKLKSSHFSFNVKGGRCENCQGAGYNLVGMHFIGEVEVECDFCHGNRFNNNILEIKYNNKNIKEVLDLSIDDAAIFFQNQKDIKQMLDAMIELGLGYLSLGQRATTLSGGEAQRVKLAAEMVKKAKQETLYIFDEPSTGLHAYDVNILLKAFKKLKRNGHSLIIVEHQEDIILSADHIIELGPKSGKYGGELVFEGSLDEFVKQKSISAQYLSKNRQRNISAKKNKDNTLTKYIEFKGVRTNNLKNIDIKIPHNQFNVFTGISGSGKSSLAFDTIYKVGSEAYYETLPTYIRSRINQQSNAKYEFQQGLTACLSLKQNKSNNNSRSTIGTYSGIYDLYRLLYSRISRNSKNIPSPQNSSYFSFNKQESACTNCKGLGEVSIANEFAFINHPEKSIYNKTITDSKIVRFYLDENGQYHWTLKALEKELGMNFDLPWNEIPEEQKQIILWGHSTEKLEVEWHFERKGRKGTHHFTGLWQGLIPLINEEYERKHADHRASAFLPIMKQLPCPVCNGERLQKEVLDYKILGKNIGDLSSLEIRESISLIKKWQKELPEKDAKIVKEVLEEILNKFLIIDRLDLYYLSINRTVKSLSGGEMQRLSIASNLGSKMSGITYVFDEPSRGLHRNNITTIINSLQEIVNKGNTVIAVEHNPQFIKQADNIFEFGPGSGNNGGELTFQGKGTDYQFPKVNIKRIKKADEKSKHFINIGSAHANNLKNINLEIPCDKIVGIHGVSGSGKTSLLREVIFKSFINNTPTNCKSIEGLDSFQQLIYVNSDIDKTNQNKRIASYLGLESPIRKLFASTESAKANKKKESFFSNTSKDGKCYNCGGLGTVSVKMDFISDINEICPECGGHGYKTEVLEYKFNDKTIAEIMSMDIKLASNILADDNNLNQSFKLLDEFGLSYLSLGSKIKQLSMGEMQRLKIAKQLLSNKSSKTLFLLDEPSKGLSNKDLQYLFNSFDKLIHQGNSIIMIEHQQDVLNQCEYLIEIGPEAGNKGGEIISNKNNYGK